jgi:type II secretory pathway predicted ATPase ExeA
LVLSGQRQRTGHFTAKLNDLCELRIELEPWDAAETANYVRYSLEQAGGDPEIFDEDSLDHLHQVTRGIPRRVRQLAELCLLAAAAEEVNAIESGIVDSVHRGLTNDGITEAA